MRSDCPEGCLAGRVARTLPKDRVHRLGRWRLNGKVYETRTGFDTRNRPCVVLATRFHVRDLEKLDARERREFGELVPFIQAQLLKRVRAKSVAVLYLNPGREHVHVHFVPRFAGDRQPPQTLLEKPLPRGIKAPSPVAVALAIAKARRRAGR